MEFTKELQDFLNQAPLAIIISDTDGLIRVVNNKSEELFGYEPGELIGRFLNHVLPDGLEEFHENRPFKYRLGSIEPPTSRKLE
jgi:PAS domain S-box-containing protein